MSLAIALALHAALGALLGALCVWWSRHVCRRYLARVLAPLVTAPRAALSGASSVAQQPHDPVVVRKGPLAMAEAERD